MKKLSNTVLRIVTSCGMLLVLFLAVCLEKYGIPFLHIHAFHAVRWLTVLIAVLCITEVVRNLLNVSKQVINKAKISIICFMCLLTLMLISSYFVGARIYLMMLLLVTIVSADIGAWLFGKIFGGDKMWERISQHKTWAGQIGGIICGSIMAVLYGHISGFSNLLWVGISVSLLSQYGDLTASYIKRRIGIKDFGSILPGHGGILDRFDGWIYVLPIVWFIIM